MVFRQAPVAKESQAEAQRRLAHLGETPIPSPRSSECSDQGGDRPSAWPGAMRARPAQAPSLSTADSESSACSEAEAHGRAMRARLRYLRGLRRAAGGGESAQSHRAEEETEGACQPHSDSGEAAARCYDSGGEHSDGASSCDAASAPFAGNANQTAELRRRTNSPMIST